MHLNGIFKKNELKLNGIHTYNFENFLLEPSMYEKRRYPPQVAQLGAAEKQTAASEVDSVQERIVLRPLSAIKPRYAWD